MAKVSKVVLGNGTVVMDISQDTVAADKLLTGYTAHGSDGEAITGTCDYDVDSSDCTASVGEVLSGETFAAGGSVLTGTMPNRGAVTGSISDASSPYTIAAGYHDGSGTVGIDTTEMTKLIAGNIKSGITILGVTGDYAGEPVNVETNKNATPSWSQQVITPDTGYDYLAQVTIAAIPYSETSNVGGGLTATIG